MMMSDTIPKGLIMMASLKSPCRKARIDLDEPHDGQG